MATFAVDDVVPPTEPLPTQPLRELFADALALGGDPLLPMLVPNGIHPLLDAVGRSFVDHRPLVLSPDAVWLTIAQGLSQHVRLNAEELRPRLVRHPGRKELDITVDGQLPDTAEAWALIVDTFGKLLAHEVDFCDCDFSTSTDVERIAGKVVMLDAYSPYFALHMDFICGIPSITLTGTAADWREIRDRIDTVELFGLETWCKSLRPIADQFVRAAEGRPVPSFWRRIFSPVDAYGGEVVTGWITRFYPYIKVGSTLDCPNPMLDLPLDEPRNVRTENGLYRGPGISTDSIPATLSKVKVTITDQLDRVTRGVALQAGLVGVTQDSDAALHPVAGWSVVPAQPEMNEVLDRIERDHQTAPQAVDTRLLSGPGDLIILDRRFGSAALLAGTWRIRPWNNRPSIELRDDFYLDLVAELPDNRWLGYASSLHWVTCRFADGRLLDDPTDIPLYGTSLAVVLSTALDFDGDITNLETGRLADVLD